MDMENFSIDEDFQVLVVYRSDFHFLIGEVQSHQLQKLQT